MKNLLLTLSFLSLFCITNLNSQNLDHAILIVFNYENGIYRGVFEDEVINTEGDWYVDRPRYENEFLEEFNKLISKKGGNPRMGVICTPEYLTELGNISAPIIKIEILTIDNKGNLTASVILQNINNPKLESSPKIFKCEGGTFGTWLNLVGDGMEALGSAVGNYVRKAL